MKPNEVVHTIGPSDPVCVCAPLPGLCGAAHNERDFLELHFSNGRSKQTNKAQNPAPGLTVIKLTTANTTQLGSANALVITRR